jgi:hypothetical protein
MVQPPRRFVLLIYRMPNRPTTHRVAVWRQLKKAGAVYLQQSVCCFPDTPAIRRELRPVMDRISEANGEFHLLALRQPGPDDQRKLEAEFLSQATKHYAEIVENCEVNFQKEIEFETFRKNFTYEEAEEIRIEFEKIVQWFDRVQGRDWFGAPNRILAQEWLQRCEKLLEAFEARVYQTQEGPNSEGRAKPAAGRRRPRAGRSPAKRAPRSGLSQSLSRPQGSDPSREGPAAAPAEISAMPAARRAGNGGTRA